jgi:hypothetical protein
MSQQFTAKLTSQRFTARLTPVGVSSGQPQTPWLTDIDAAGYSLSNLASIGIGTVNPTSKLCIVGLPTSSAGLKAGDIWVDTANGNVLKIV